jgi:hypothetical protein
MMRHEFNNRIVAQRAILRAVNHKVRRTEQLFGLSSKAIDRWVSVNRLESESPIVKLVRNVSTKLFFLANKSQEQISDEYTIVRAEIAAACEAIERETDSTTA